MFRVFTVSSHAGMEGDRLLGPLPPRLTGTVYHDFLGNFLPDLLQDVDFQATIYLWFMHDCGPPNFLIAVRDFLNNNMACFFYWFKFLIFLFLMTSEGYSICYSSQWYPGLAAVDTEWTLNRFIDTWALPTNQTIIVQTYNVLCWSPAWTLRAFCVIFWKP